jgi:hypothetical protein
MAATGAPVRSDPRAIPDTLKEAVVDAVLNTVIDRLSGRGNYGRIIFGTKPRTALASGFLLPFDQRTDGDEESASIRICSHGLDMLVATNTEGVIRAQPYCALYVRVLPSPNEILRHPNCDPKFTLKKEIARELRKKIRERSREAVRSLKDRWKDPQWPEIDLRIRREAYAELGIPFASGTAEETTEEPAADAEGEEVESGVRVSGRVSIPDHLATESQIPQKWLRLEVELPALEFKLDGVAAAVESSNRAVRDALDRRLAVWKEDTNPDTGGKLWGYRRARKIRPSDVKNWQAFLDEIRNSKLEVLTPEVALDWYVNIGPDYANPGCNSVRITLENRSVEPAPSVYTFKETEQAAFQVRLDVLLPKAMHRHLMADRVEPSYRYYEYLAYPALGVNGGVERLDEGATLYLRTSWTPRYHQPRIIPSSLGDKGVIANIESLSKPNGIAGLRPLITCFKTWFEQIKKFPFDAGIDKGQTEIIARERDQFEHDKDRWVKEIDAIEVGITILEESASYWKGPGVPADKRAVPFEAWLAMNETMAQVAKAKAYDEWRLFQLAFILANLSALVTRMPEFQDRYAPMEKYINSVTLLYFATGGGKSEAFLGLLVFDLFLDRLRGKERGVTAMLRYPLRLLTLQQAQRTAKTLARAELIRRTRAHPGEPFSIGFWVGSANTPNSLASEDVRGLPDVGKYPRSAEAKLLNTNNAYARAVERWNKLPECPFCASEKGTGLRRFPSLGGLLGHLCLNDDCVWNCEYKEPTPLPFYIVDEDIYEMPPSVILGTVDKLALLGQSQRTIRRFLGMFGFALGYRPDTGRLYSPDPRKKDEISKPQAEQPFVRLFPTYADGEKRFFDPFPSLLIQDEAHLLDESLGTFAGLFETAMDAALDQLGPLLGDQLAKEPGGKRRKVKVIAASATVSDPQRQMRNIYQREDTVQFPYPGPELYRSFYAAPRGPEANETERLALPDKDVEGRSHWGRVYQTILTNGHTHTVTVVEVLANFHVTITSLYERLKSGDPVKVAEARTMLLSELSAGRLRPLFERELNGANEGDLATLIDLHRITLTYVTNKKGGDQIMAAESVEFDKKHRYEKLDGYRLHTDLITGAVDAGHIQEVIHKAEDRPRPGSPFVELNGGLRSIVATSAVSHGVDVEELNSMFFAGMPSDIAEYIQASSRVGRTHVGFCVLVPAPQRRRDRFIVEVHDIFHRFLERMIAPAAIDRWAEKAVERVIASFLQAYLCGVRAVRLLAEAPDADKSKQHFYKMVQEAKSAERDNPVAFKHSLAQFIEEATGLRLPYAPHDKAYYQDLIRNRINDVFDDMSQPRFGGAELGNFLTTRNIELRPMMSLRDVDKPGRIVPATRDARDDRSIRAELISRVMRLIRGGSGAAIDDEETTEE